MSEQQNLTIVRQENVQMIAQSAPQIYNDNTLSCQRCSEYGQKLLDQIKANGMNDELDQQCAAYIVKAKNTVKKMNTNRSAITKIFDQIRSEFTGMENAVDPTKANSIPNQIQQARNAYAAKKREEEEKKRKEAMIQYQREQAYNAYKQNVENDYKSQFNIYTTQYTNALTQLNTGLTLDNYEANSKAIREFPVELADDWGEKHPSQVQIPMEIADLKEQLSKERANILARLLPHFKEQYNFEIASYRDSLMDMLPSKKAELERMQKANEKEKARMAAELKTREQAEAERIEAERKRKEEEEAAKQKMQAEASEISNLFGQQAIVAPAGYQPKTSVKKKISINSPEGIMAVVSFWWAKEGQHLPLEDLVKTFKKQITFCEKAANDKSNPEFINSSSVTYTDEIKAK